MMSFIKIELFILVILVITIMIIRFRGLSLIGPLVKELARQKPLVEEKEIMLGIQSLEYSLGLALIAVMWEIYLRYFQVTGVWTGAITLTILLLITILAYQALHYLKKAFYLAVHVESQRKTKIIKIR